jgi:serine/threonine protein kinase
MDTAPGISKRIESLAEQFIDEVNACSVEARMRSDVLFARVCAQDPELAPAVWVLLREICPLLAIPLPPPPVAPIDPRGDRGDRFDFGGVVGVGGMGVVHECHDPELGRTVAVKSLLPIANSGAGGLGVKPDSLDIEPRAPGSLDQAVWRQALFIREAAIASRLDHPGIVQVYEIGRHSKHGLYYAMRLVGGETVLAAIGCLHRRERGWDRKRFISVIVKVCRAMAHAHARGVIHRDLKPNNIKVENYDDACVIDWGLARWTQSPCLLFALPSGTQDRPAPDVTSAEPRPTEVAVALSTSIIDLGSLGQGDVVGTPDYMAPEQARGEASPCTDVYSIGALLYHVLANHKPFPGAKEDVLARLRREPPPEPPALPADCPPELAAICRKAMAWDVANRYGTADELATDLQRWLDLKIVDAYAYAMKPLAALAKWCRRNPVYAAVVVAVIVLATAVATIVPGALDDRRSLRRLKRGEDLSTFVLRDANQESLHTGESAAQWWLREARSLAADEDHGLAALVTDLEDLHASATRQFDAFAPVRGSEYAVLLDVLAAKREERIWRARMLGREPWLSTQAVADQLARLQVPAEWLQRNRRAFDLINPDRPRTHYGYEQCAVALAEQALALAVTHHERSRCLDTLACALARVGRFEEALTRQVAAVDAARTHHENAPATKTTDENGNLNGPDDWYRSFLGNQHWLERERSTWAGPEEERRYQALVEEIRDLEWLTAVLGYRYVDVALEGRRSHLESIVRQLRALNRRIRFEAEAAAADGTKRWRDAIAAIAASETYGRRRITPQLDLLPLGEDPKSGLQEFVFLPSGFMPERNQAGELVMTRNSGMVLVLVPGVDGGEPFFLSKWELSNSQWARIAGWWPHSERDIAAMSPAAAFAQTELDHLIVESCSDLRVPTAAEWLHACRAGRSPDWLQHETHASATRFATLRVAGRSTGLAAIQGPTDSGGTKLPNDYGIFDMVGNVAEVVAVEAGEVTPFLQGRITGRSNWGYIGGSCVTAFAGLSHALKPDTEFLDGRDERGCRLARSLMR